MPIANLVLSYFLAFAEWLLERRAASRSGEFRAMRWLTRIISIASVALPVMAVRVGSSASAASAPSAQEGPSFLPTGEATKIVTVTKGGEAQAAITVLTEAVAVRETGPKATVKKFGEVYAFSPAFIVVHRDQPTQLEFWNLQPDDEHDFALVGPDLKSLMYVTLPPLKKTSFIFTFHREGVMDFKCLRHQPEMSGQILVLPPVAK